MTEQSSSTKTRLSKKMQLLTMLMLKLIVRAEMDKI